MKNKTKKLIKEIAEFISKHLYDIPMTFENNSLRLRSILTELVNDAMKIEEEKGK